MVEAVFIALVAALIGLLLWSLKTIQYTVTSVALEISWLGRSVRRIPLSLIKRVTNRPVFWAERWYNTLCPNRRHLAIRLRSGWCKTILITPRNPFVFKAELDRALKTASDLTAGPMPPASVVEMPGRPQASAAPDAFTHPVPPPDRLAS